MKPKALVFYTYLPPWRIDVFNEMAKQYDLTIVFVDGNAQGFTYNRELLLSKLTANTIFLDGGFSLFGKPIRLKIYSILKKVKPSVVFTHEYFPTSIFLATFLRLNLFTFKLIVTTSDNLDISKNVGFLKSKFRNYILKVSHGIVVYSDNVKEWYKFNFPNLKVEICPNIQNSESLLMHKSRFPDLIEEYKLQYNLSENVILYIGRLEHVKGLDLLIKAFARFSNMDYKLVIVGDGSERHNLKHIAEEEGVSTRVIFPGYYDDYKLYAWYALSSFFVLPSRFEPFGAVVNESLVFGCPVLASKNIGALDYIKVGQNGYIFDPSDIQSFVCFLDKMDKLYINLKSNSLDEENLMPLSFSDYVSAFVNVVN